MATKHRGFRALGIVGFAALTVTLVSACNGNGTVAANSNGNGSAVTSTVPASGQGSASGTVSGYSSVTTTPAAVGVPAAVAASVGKCQPTNLSFALGNNRQTGQGQRAQVVDMTNHASSACTMEGFPVVDVIGDTTSQPSLDWTLVRSSANGIAKVTLRPGATAHFDLIYLPGDLASGGGSKNVISVQKMVIMTPGEDSQRDDAVGGSLPWFQDVVLQDGATHPGTYIMPLASGS